MANNKPQQPEQTKKTVKEWPSSTSPQRPSNSQPSPK